MQTETLIIGGGLCGLSLAQALNRAGRNCHLVEARDRLGGRILSEAHQGARFDLGPAWFWPGQPRIQALVDDLGLKRFEQFADGELTFEDPQGNVQRGHGFASMQGSFRLQGGIAALIEALAAKIPAQRISVATEVRSIAKTDDGVVAGTSDGRKLKAKSAVLALPLRLASLITFDPLLPRGAHDAMDAAATWMAGHAKVVAVYAKPFWREAGLSGDAMSRHGPMVEIHDASPSDGGPFALFGFIGTPPHARNDQFALETAVLAQFGRLFGTEAARPESLFIKDWAYDPHTATQRDQEPLYTHPRYGLPPALAGVWDDRLIFSGTETASEFGGFLEGALEASEAALVRIAQARVTN